MWKYGPPECWGRTSMRWLALFLTYIFLFGLAGSGLVILVTFWSDLEAFTPDDVPSVAEATDRTKATGGLKRAEDSHAG
jgi:hypothetical protein